MGKRRVARMLIIGAILVGPLVLLERLVAQRSPRTAPLPFTLQPASAPSAAASQSSRAETTRLARIAIDYPAQGSIFPPEITAPTFVWRDAPEGATAWRIDVAFADGSAGIRAKSPGERMRIGQIDPRCVAATNELPKLTPEEAAAHTWKPDEGTWAAIKKHSVGRPATVTITGFRDKDPNQAVSRGTVVIQTSKDRVGAPIFFRDVPLMPSELEKGVIKPLPQSALPLIAWRLRYVGEPSSQLLLEGLHTCANCHSFSRDGTTLGMDLDGPENDKGLYAIVPIDPQMSIRNQDVISWTSFHDEPVGKMRIGFMSQVSPDGQYVVTTVNGGGKDIANNYYVANFKDYRFLQVFYPTRGILAWYSRATGQRHDLPGADDPRYVQTGAVWSPDGKYFVFARAAAKDPYPNGWKMPEHANDPDETQIQYDLYRIPFNGGKGGQAEPIAGASENGMSNSFPKISPDGRWIVFVKCHNAELMRPDGQLYIVPARGGQARRMRCNTPLMNSWHSFSPNGRWLVFSSKSRSPYTQMFLAHLDEEGNDSPAILIENATAANRAVNIPEFLNIPPNGLEKIEVPAAEFYRRFDRAVELTTKGQDEAAIAAWKEALEIDPGDARAQNHLGAALLQEGRLDEAITHLQKAVEVKPEFGSAQNNFGVALMREGKFDEALTHFQNAVEVDPEFADAQNNLGGALLQKGRFDEAIAHLQKALEVNPEFADAQSNLGIALSQKGRVEEAITHLQRALELNPGQARNHYNLGNAFYLQGKIPEALARWREGLDKDPNNLPLLKQTAWLLATCPQTSVRNGPEALELAERAVQLSAGQDPEALDTLAAADAEVGRFAEALKTTRRALDLARQQDMQPLAETLKARIALYEAKTPYRESQ